MKFKRLYSIKELAEHVGGTIWFWRNLISTGRLPAVRVGTKQLVDSEDVEKLIRDHKTTTPSA